MSFGLIWTQRGSAVHCELPYFKIVWKQNPPWWTRVKAPPWPLAQQPSAVLLIKWSGNKSWEAGCSSSSSCKAAVNSKEMQKMCSHVCSGNRICLEGQGWEQKIHVWKDILWSSDGVQSVTGSDFEEDTFAFNVGQKMICHFHFVSEQNHPSKSLHGTTASQSIPSHVKLFLLFFHSEQILFPDPTCLWIFWISFEVTTALHLLLLHFAS